ncbi:hypothetical protein GCM10011612_13520 [Actinomyces gaoshouyii]|uniref:Transposase n=1 Tax=Actinomyces gaoshouyii TaxID=1960083 RepID=A0A8H9LG85_9ACTO|nr:hypothetical protein GCM10011612_13520 [Actinomyces gaoshouyii]
MSRVKYSEEFKEQEVREVVDKEWSFVSVAAFHTRRWHPSSASPARRTP